MLGIAISTLTPPGRSLTLRGTAYPVRLPTRRDPRLHLAATITSIQVLGQAALGWELSIAQILVCLLSCALIEVPLVFWESRVIAWPASALLTGNGVALVLRVNGTEHGDWWSLHGWYIFAATSALALVSKHVLRFDGRPIVNPSNLGLVVVFVLLGTGLVNPLDFWWGPWGVDLAAVYLILGIGAFAITRRLHLLWMSLSFWAVLTASLGVLSAGGHCLSARWSVTPVCGTELWRIIATSPEVLIFMFFMITDPMTSPQKPRARVVFGASVGLASALLIAPMRTEFGAKVGLLGGLVLVCALRPLVTVLLRRTRMPALPTGRGRRVVLAGATALVAAAALTAAGLPARQPASLGVAVASDALQRRPMVAGAGQSVPEVEVATEVQTVVGSEAREQADTMALHLVEDLTIVEDAIEADDPSLAASAAAGAYLDRLRAGMADGSATSIHHSFTHMTVLMARDPADQQAIPRFAIRATGTRTREGVDEPFDRVFVLQQASGFWLVTDERDPSEV